MNYLQQSSLEHIALVRIAISLWQQSDIRNLIIKLSVPFKHGNGREYWRRIEDKVMKNALQLPQPELLKQRVSGFIKPIGLEILKWIKYSHGSYSNDQYIDLPNVFHWTLQGTIDKAKTAEALIRDPKIDIRTRYNLACIYCLEDHIQELWNKIPVNRRNIFHDPEYPMQMIQQDLVYLWTNDLYRIMATTDKPSDCHFQHGSFTSLHAFRVAVTYGNKAAMEYFLPKLTPADREAALMDAAKQVATRCRKYNIFSNADSCNEHCNEILCFLISHMREENQMEIFKNHAYGVLKCCLDWSLQSCFIKYAPCSVRHLSEEHYLTLLELIINKVTCGFKDCDYLNLFSEFWSLSNTNYKIYVMDECAAGVLLPRMFLIKDVEYIKVIFKNASVIMRKCFVLGRGGFDICKRLVYDDDWDLLKFFITECVASKRDMLKLIQRYEEYVTNDGEKGDNCDNLFHRLDALLCGFDESKSTVPKDKISKIK